MHFYHHVNTDCYKLELLLNKTYHSSFNFVVVWGQDYSFIFSVGFSINILDIYHIYFDTDGCVFNDNAMIFVSLEVTLPIAEMIAYIGTKQYIKFPWYHVKPDW